MVRFFSRVCGDSGFRYELAQNLNNWRDWLVATGTLLLFYWIVLAIHLAIHPIFFGWWIPIVAMYGGYCLSSRYEHYDLRGPLVSFLWFVAVMALLPYLCVYHWNVVSGADALGVGLRSLFTTVITEPFSGRPYDPHYINLAWWTHLVPCWVVTAIVSYLLWLGRREWRIVCDLPRWSAK